MYPILSANVNPRAPWVAVNEGFLTLQDTPANYPLLCHTFLGEELRIQPADEKLYRFHVDDNLVYRPFYRLFIDGHHVGTYYPSLLLHVVSLFVYNPAIIAIADEKAQVVPRLSYAWVFEDDQRTYVIGRVDTYEQILLQMQQFLFVSKLTIGQTTWKKRYGIPHLFLELDDNIVSMQQFVQMTGLIIKQTPQKVL